MTTPTTPEHPRRTRRFWQSYDFVFWYLGLSSVVISILVVFVAILIFRVDNVARGQQQANVQQCMLANVTRQQDIAIWNRLLNVTGPVSAAARAEIRELESLVKTKDTPKDCIAIYG